jgi:hypothetical protein
MPDHHQISAFYVFDVGLPFAYVSNTQIIMIFYEFCPFAAYFGYIILNIRNFE